MKCSYSRVELYILHAIYHLRNFLEIFFVFLKPVCDLLCLISIRNKNFKHEKEKTKMKTKSVNVLYVLFTLVKVALMALFVVCNRIYPDASL